MNAISVRIFAHHPLVKASYLQLLAEYPQFHLASGFEPAEAICPEVGVFDQEATSLHAELVMAHQRCPALRPLLLLPSCDDNTGLSWLRCGISGIVLHSRLEQELPDAIRHVANGQLWFPAPVILRWVRSHALVVSPQNLTSREQEVMALLSFMRSNKEIAVDLRISERTAKFHVGNILRKTALKSRQELIQLQHMVV